jgi:hypothetical protein
MRACSLPTQRIGSRFPDIHFSLSEGFTQYQLKRFYGKT